MRIHETIWRVAVVLFCSKELSGQKVNDLLNSADDFLASGNISAAAEQYEKAGRLKMERPEILFKAAETYYSVRDYQKAADCYRSVKENYDKFEIAGLRYARCLKQEGRYAEAKEEFKKFLAGYKGERKAQIISMLTAEIGGCETALAWSERKIAPAAEGEVKILPEWICSQENEFAPLPFTENLLYYSAVKGNRVYLMRSQRKDGVWQPPVEAGGLPESASVRYGNGAFSPDGKRFYCTQCEEPNSAQKGGNGIKNRCAIYVLRRNGQGWSEPERLHPYVNMPDAATTHPHVWHRDGYEVLFFSSNRSGGFGGMDLYVCERPLDSEDNDFSFPRNLGHMINTAGDEVTPYYDVDSRTLWFSGNGHSGFGGLDIFHSEAGMQGWTKPQNAGLPLNSSADDLFYIQKPQGSGAFLVSNRLYGAEKTSTRHEDIFEYSFLNRQKQLHGSILDATNGGLLTGCMVAFYELEASGEKQLLGVKPASEGIFKSAVEPGKRYLLEIAKEGYETASLTLEGDLENIVVQLKPHAAPKFSEGGDAGDATLYMVQIEVVNQLNPADKKYEYARTWGEVGFRELPEDPEMKKVSVGPFKGKAAANKAAAALRASGYFPQAFITKIE